MEGRGLSSTKRGYNCLWRSYSKTQALFMASPIFIAEISQPSMTRSLGFAMGKSEWKGRKTSPFALDPSLIVEA